MMKSALMILLFVFPFQPRLEIEEIRKMFYLAAESSDKAKDFQETLKQIDESNPLLLGYKGMAEMIMAKHSYNPVSKVTFFRRGKAFLEKAIELDPKNAELRYLRFSLQSNAPSFLNYNDDLDKDKAVIIDYLTSAGAVARDLDLETRMKAFIKESDYFSNKEKNLIKNQS